MAGCSSGGGDTEAAGPTEAEVDIVTDDLAAFFSRIVRDLGDVGALEPGLSVEICVDVQQRFTAEVFNPAILEETYLDHSVWAREMEDRVEGVYAAVAQCAQAGDAAGASAAIADLSFELGRLVGTYDDGPDPIGELRRRRQAEADAEQRRREAEVLAERRKREEALEREVAVRREQRWQRVEERGRTETDIIVLANWVDPTLSAAMRICIAETLGGTLNDARFDALLAKAQDKGLWQTVVEIRNAEKECAQDYS